LSPKGKDANWVKSTANCRELLGKLRLGNPLVRKYRPRVNDLVQMLRRTDSFDWKKRTAIEFLENMLTDLITGVEPTRRYAGRGLGFPYWSERLQRVEAIWVHVPPGYDPARTYQLFIYYKCGGGIHYKDGKAHGGYRPTVEVANQTDTFHAWSSLSTQVKGRMGVDYELMEAVAALAKAFSIDPDRVFLSGWSDGGFTAIWLASRYPHLVAGIAPNCANWQYSNVNQIGLSNVPMLVVDGWYDGGYVQGNFCRWHALHTMGCDVAGIFGQHGHSYQPYEDVAEFRRILDWAKTKRRNLWPRRVRYATWNLSWHRAFWFSIERMVNPSLAAQIDAKVEEGNRIEARVWNVAAYKLLLSDKLLNPRRPLQVFTNGSESYSGPFKSEITIEVIKLPEGKYVKCAEMPGGITAQITRSTYGLRRGGGLRIPGRKWLWVKPTGGEEKTQKLLSQWAPEWAKPDVELTEADIATGNLFVYGGPEINRFSARVASELPVKLGKGKFTIGKRVYDQPTNCVKFLHPNPLNPEKYVIVYAFNDAAAFAENGFFGTTEESSWGFRSGDCVVMGVPGRKQRWGVAVATAEFEKDHYIFDSNWRPPDETPIGELGKPFDFTQILRLRADATREATGADVAVMSSYPPGWNRWASSLPAGPVTVHDIATTAMFPEYIALCGVRGEVLANLVKRAAASTVLAHKRDPSYQPGRSLALSEINPQKAYRVAMSCYGLPSYGVEPKKMPKLFFFTSPKEFLASGHTSLPVRNLRQIPLEFTEAVARYIKERKRISPRPVCFDLAQYIMNPQVNEFGARDWVHLGADLSWKRPQTGKPLRYRYTLNLGLGAAGDPELAPPRKNSKKFLDLDLTGAEAVTADFSKMGKKLPVSLNANATEFAIAADKSGTTFRLAGAEAADGVVGRGILVDIRLANQGERDVTGLAALAPTAMLRVEGPIWPEKQLGAPLKSYCIGFRQAIGPRGKPPIHQNAALFLFDGPGHRVERLVANNAGYNFGLIAIRRSVSVKAGAAASLPLLFVAADGPIKGKAIDLAAVLDALKDEIVKKLSVEDKGL